MIEQTVTKKRMRPLSIFKHSWLFSFIVKARYESSATTGDSIKNVDTL